MADEELLGPMEEIGEAEDEEEEGGGGGVPWMRYLPLVLVVLLVQVLIGYVLVSWLFSPPEAPPPEPVVEEEAPALPEKPMPVGPAEVEVIYEKLEPIVVNPADTQGLRFLSTEIHLGLASPQVESFIDSKNLKSRIVDTLISVLQSKTLAQLQPRNHEKLKAELKEKLNAFLGDNSVVEVYFMGFVLQ